MKQRKKVIHILPYSLSAIDANYSVPASSHNNLPYGLGWHSKLAIQLQMILNDFDIECWGVDKNLNEHVVYMEDGITYRLFPSIYVKFIGDISYSLIHDLGNLLNKEQAIIHIHGLFNYTSYFILLLFGCYPIVIQHHGEVSLLQSSVLNARDSCIKCTANFILYIIKMDWLLERISLSKADKIFVLNEDMKKYLACKTNDQIIEKLTMGIDFDTFKKIGQSDARDRLGLKHDAIYILYSGALVKRKGIVFLIEAFLRIKNDFSNSFLLLKGDGYYKEYLQQHTKILGLDNSVIFIPWVESKELPYYYNSSNICILPSDYEGFGIVAVEALACETPFIGTNAGGIPEIVENFQNGILVRPKSADDIYYAIKSILGDQRRFEINRENARKHYDWNNIVKINARVYYALWEKYYNGQKTLDDL